MEDIAHNESTISRPCIWRQDHNGYNQSYDKQLMEDICRQQDVTGLVPPYSPNWRRDDVQTQLRNILGSTYEDTNRLKVWQSPSKGRQDNLECQSELQNILQSSIQDATTADFSGSPCKLRQDGGLNQSNIHSNLSSSLQDAYSPDVSTSPCKWRQYTYSPKIRQSPSKWRPCKAKNQFNTPKIFVEDDSISDFTRSLFKLRQEMSTPHQNEASYNQNLSIKAGRDVSTGNNSNWLDQQGTISPSSTPSNTYNYPDCTEGLSLQFLARQQYKGFKNPTSSIAGQSLLSSGRSVSGELFFPSAGEVQGVASLKRQVQIPPSFPSVASYKQVFTSALKEHLNLILFNLGQRFHTARNKVDTQCLDSSTPLASIDNPQASRAPQCNHGNAAKMVCVKKEGKNKGRFFYACSAPRSNQCKFFLWADQFKSDPSSDAKGSSSTKISLMEPNAAMTFFKSQNVRLYYGCEFRRTCSYNSMLPGAPAWAIKRKQQMMKSTKKKLYLNLSWKEASTSYGKDDIWVISKDLTFDPRSTFLAKSVYHGPSSNNDVEIEPLACYSTSNWPSPCTVHAILACNASSELVCLSNLKEHVNSTSVPILQSLINRSDNQPITQSRLSTFKSPAQAQSQSKFLNYPPQEIDHIATLMIETYKLNTDQAKALRRVAKMFQQTSNDNPNPEPVTLIHGVFGAGKSFLLAVIVLFLVKLFKLSEEQNPEAVSQRSPWKLLIASTTNVAVDRILLVLLGLGFEDFIRVGSLRKIAKPILPYSVHASDKKDSQEIKDLYEMLKTDLTPTEKSQIRRSLERQRLGQNRDLLSSVKVVGVTCAACTFPCMSKLIFPVILLDECSQMTEPSSMLPIARFQCEKLVLVGDPKQLDPTIQGSEAAHSYGLEQTLFNRLIHQGYEPILLRTQYRCHPRISAIANCLFYNQQLEDGVVAEDRPPLTASLPTLCFFSVPSGKECCARDGSFFNEEEASFVIYLIDVLMSLGVEAGDVGVITLYKAQTMKISMMLQDSKLANQKGIKAIQISTVDAFQGGEKSVIILSCVRTDYMGFADSDKRTNVALTRSKNHLFIVGNLRMLLANNLWSQVINLCKDAENGIQTSKGFVKEWTPKLEELQKLEEETKSQKQGQRSKASQETSTELEEVEKETSCQTAGVVSKDPQGQTFSNKCLLETSELPHLPTESSLHNESPSFSPFYEVEDSVLKDSKLEESQVGVSALCNISPSYSPLSGVEESESEDSFTKEHPPCFDIGGLEDILE
ncbi:protein ZGRF1-like isoform X3 [Asterias rubens]|uniref:protein ZGRF1-like isoform X3 n=1 Tax=Asterias rubens TaxID=7604 RepID=UPI00145573E1|nr:protein ZGRF1-like isoform X3 [Asterias rubens]